MQTAGRDRPGRRRVRRGPGRRRRRVRRGALRARAVDDRRARARCGRRGLTDGFRTGMDRARRPASRSSSGPWRPRCARRTVRSRSPSWRSGIGTTASSGSTSPVPRRATRPAGSPTRSTCSSHASFHLTLHAGEGYGLPSIREALDLGAERLGHGVRIVDDIAVEPGGQARRSAGSPRTSATGGSRSSCAPTSNVHTGSRRRRSPTTRSTCCAGSASGSPSTRTTGS